jgi:hypothetical protein
MTVGAWALRWAANRSLRRPKRPRTRSWRAAALRAGANDARAAAGPWQGLFSGRGDALIDVSVVLLSFNAARAAIAVPLTVRLSFIDVPIAVSLRTFLAVSGTLLQLHFKTSFLRRGSKWMVSPESS